MKITRIVRSLRALAPAAFLALAADLAAADTILVDQGGSGDYTTISDAVANASDGDVILVSPGTYVEEVIVDVSVTIVGSGVGQTIVTPAHSIPGSGNGSQVTTTTWVFRIQDDGVTISSLTVDGDNPALSSGIDARGGIITDYSTGTFHGLQVVGCEVANVVYRGIYAAAGGTGHSFVLNTVRNVKQVHLDSVGIFFYGAQGEARGNDVEDCSIGMGFQSGGGGTFAGNAIRLCDLGILANGSSVPVAFEANEIDDSDQGVQSIAVNTTVDIAGNAIAGCGSGITLFGLGSGAVNVAANEIDGAGELGTYGVFATTDVSPWGYGDLTSVLSGNTLRDTELAVVLHESSLNNTPALACAISGAAAQFNTFTGSLAFNVYLQDCDDDTNATYNFWGVANPARIEDTIWHQIDDPVLGLVDFANAVNLVVTVDDDGPADYTTINPAVQALEPGGTVLVMPGLYVEDVVIDRACLVQGSGSDSDPAVGTVLRGASVHPDMTVVTVTASDVAIDALRVDGQQPTYDQARRAVYAANVAGLTVTDCVLHTATTGIAYVTSTDGTFLRNEVYDFGVNLNLGGGIFLWNATGLAGTRGNGNYVHDGLAAGVIYHNSSNGTATDDLVVACPLGYLSNGASGLTVFQNDEARACDQGFQGIANQFPVDYVECTAYDCETGFTLFGLGAQVHSYTRSFVHHRLGSGGSSGFFFTTECSYGDDDLNAIARGCIVTGAAYGIVLDESASSMPYAMSADFNGSTDANWITGALAQDILLQVCDDDVDATYNYFGSTDAGVVEGKITHHLDDPALGFVDFAGLRAPGPDARRRGELEDGREIGLIVTGTGGQISIPVYATSPATIPTPFGILLVDPGTAVLLGVFPVDASGLQITEAILPPGQISGTTIYFQALVGNPGSWALTDRDEVSTP
ncbi:MAG: right-handed parallel beta-helix repeat-containing protein [Planctomycetota bacterium]